MWQCLIYTCLNSECWFLRSVLLLFFFWQEKRVYLVAGAQSQRERECSVIGRMMKLFDAHCHLQDPRIISKAPQLIATALDTGVVRFAVNGVSEVPFFLSFFLSFLNFSSHFWMAVVVAERLAFSEADGWELSFCNSMFWPPSMVKTSLLYLFKAKVLFFFWPR